MKKIIALILAVMMLTCLFVGCEKKTESDKEYITNKGEMVIGITLFAPMNYNDADGKLIGFETEFAEAVCAKLGVTPKFQEIDWNSKEIELNAKNIDCIWNGMTIKPELEANLSISTPYMKNKQVMVVKAENAEKYIAGVDGAKIVAEAGSAGEAVVAEDEFLKKGTYVSSDSMATALLDVKSGNADVAIIDYIAALGSIGEGTDFADLVVVESLSFGPDEKYGIAFRKDSDMTAEVNKAIAELIADGTLDKIAAKYKLSEYIIK